MMQGITLSHEHMTLDLSGVKHDQDSNLNCFEQTLEEIRRLKGMGVSNIIEVTNIGMGRNPEFCKRIEAGSGVHIVLSTGFYKEPFLPPFFHERTEAELADLLVSELEDGIGGSREYKAQVIGEIGTSLNEMTQPEKKLFEAAVLAHRKTGAVISTHTTLGTMIAEQADFFLNHGVDPARVYIGHTDLSKNLETISGAINRGFYVGFDTVGKNNYFPDEKRCEMLKELEVRNQTDHVMLSMDITRKSHLKAFGGSGYCHLMETFVPMLEKAGLRDSTIEKLLVTNARTFFGGILEN